MGRSSAVARDPDADALRDQHYEALQREVKLLRRELIIQKSANAYLRQKMAEKGRPGPSKGSPMGTGAETEDAVRPPSPVPAAGDPHVLGVLAEMSATLSGMGERLTRVERRSEEPPAIRREPSRPLVAAPIVGETATAAEPGWETATRRRRERRKRAKAARGAAAASAATLPPIRKPSFAAVAAGHLPARPSAGRAEQPAAAVDSRGKAREPRGAAGRKIPSKAPAATRAKKPTAKGAAPQEGAKGKGVEKTAATRALTRPVAAKTSVPPQLKGGKKKRVRRAARSAAVSISVAEGKSLAEAMRRVRASIQLSEMGIDRGLRPKRTATGGLLLEVPGANSAAKADKLYEAMSRVVAGEEGVTVSRPRRSVELRLSGFDETVTPTLVKATIATIGGCEPDLVRVGTIRYTRRGLGSIWARCPAEAGYRIIDGETLVLGWARTRVEELKRPSLKCFKCLAQGHVQQRCPSKHDRRLCCFNCGLEGHNAVECKGRPHCPPCAERGLLADHRPGVGPGCKPWPPKAMMMMKTAGAEAPDPNLGAGDRSVDTIAEEGIVPSPVSSTDSPEQKRARVSAPRATEATIRRLSVVVERADISVAPDVELTTPPGSPKSQRDPRLRPRKKGQPGSSRDEEGKPRPQ